MTAATASNVASSVEVEEPGKVRLRRVVRRGLTSRPKMLPPWLLYDSAGSRLFEDITELPEYYLTRTERGIFAEHASEIIHSAAGGYRLEIMELGAGSAAKTGLLLEATVRQQGHTRYRAIDVSPTALKEARARLEAEIEGVEVQEVVADYTVSLKEADAPLLAQEFDGEEAQRRLLLWIGSSIGNFDPDEAAALLAHAREQMEPGDGLLLGIDMVKDLETLVAAYNDSAGITAQFNKNGLVRINRELRGDFDISKFRHEAIWNPVQSRIEMHLRSVCEHEVSIAELGLRIQFKRGETIHTENSYKFTRAGILSLLDEAGFSAQKCWNDRRQWFSVQLARAI